MSFLNQFPFEPYNLQSRIHSLKSMKDTFIKRDDELSCMISGSKVRKYATLIPHLKKLKLQSVGLIGGAFSNNLVGLSQLLIENQIDPILFIRKPACMEKKGNFLLLQLLIKESNIHFIERNNWKEVEEIAKNKELYVIPEGAKLLEAIPGAMTLSNDIIRNQKENDCSFNHIFVDAGTGLQAIGLILGHVLNEIPATIHVIQLAPIQFEDTLNYFIKELSKKYSFPNIQYKNYKLWLPKESRSFGSVNQKILNKIAIIAKDEGVFLDPIYSAKLFIEMERIIKEENLMGKKLMIHSGGSLSLFGYM